MSYWNVPDDWGNYYNNCETCGSRYHASEGGCGNCFYCERCGETKHHTELSEHEDICMECWTCGICGKDEENNAQYFVLDKDEAFDPRDPPGDTYTYCLECKAKEELKYRLIPVTD